MLEIKWPSPAQEVLIKPEASRGDSTAVRGVVAVPHRKGNLGQRSQGGGASGPGTWLPQLLRFA